MQFTIEVLPAPFGPMMENNSPSFTPKETSVSARTPPKRSDTPRTSKACSTQSLRSRRYRALCLDNQRDEPFPGGRSTGLAHTIVLMAKSHHVMPGRVPGIHVFLTDAQGVDKPGQARP